MDRCAVFVDAGYLLAEGAKALLSPSARRGDVTVDHARIVAALSARAREASGLPLLRLYWYDGAVDGVPTGEHLEVASLPDVKLRLGRVTSGRQKGVDALVYRDLSVLARERAIADAFLVAGDEDLREGITWAQELGVRVTLWGIGTAKNQSRTLVSEADRVGRLDDLVDRFEAAPGSLRTIAEAEPAPAVLDPAALYALGWSHAETWSARAEDEDVAELVRKRPWIPHSLDIELIALGQATAGDLTDAEALRHALRSGFWSGMDVQVRKR